MELFLVLCPIFLGMLFFSFLEFFNYFTNLVNLRSKYYLDFFNFGIFLSYISFLLSLKLWYNFNCLINQFQYEIFYFFYSIFLKNGLNYNLIFHLGIDGISLYFILLTTFLSVLCLVVSKYYIKARYHSYLFYFFLLEFVLIISFCVLDLFFFFIFFEIILIPMFLIIILWGSRARKILAAYYFFLYTSVGSLLILIGILILSSSFGTTNIFFLWSAGLSLKKQWVIWFFFFLGFCVKIPMFPVHLWLPEAHVEAPTAGSIILAGILLKLGSYAYIRFLLPLCPLVMQYNVPFLFCLCLLSIIYSSFVILRQMDIKKIIAYSSIIHMNVGILGLFCLNYSGLEGSLYLMIGHGLISSGLFLLIGCIYERYKTRIIYYYGGLVKQMPIFSLFFFLFTLSNISFPGTINFISEFVTFLGIFNYSFFSGFISLFFVMFFGAFYSIWLFNRLIFGELKVYKIGYYFDLNFNELISLLVLFFLICYFGINSSIFFNFINFSVQNIILNVV